MKLYRILILDNVDDTDELFCDEFTTIRNIEEYKVANSELEALKSVIDDIDELYFTEINITVEEINEFDGYSFKLTNDEEVVIKKHEVESYDKEIKNLKLELEKVKLELTKDNDNKYFDETFHMGNLNSALNTFNQIKDPILFAGVKKIN